ncbi:hypothetical protein ACLMJK_001672 [Lecanora helva]
MATGNAWLQKQRKPDLAEIADHVGLKNHARYRKNELEIAVEQILREKQTSLEKDPRVAPFYQGVDPSSPVKHNAGPATEKTKARQRRQTLKKEELEAASESEPSSPIKSLATRTPSRTLTVARNVPLPPSPAVLVNQIDATTSSLRTSVTSYISSSRLPGTLEGTRAYLSTVTSIELLTLFVEAWGLRAQVLPMKYLTNVPAIPALGTGEIAIKAPDFFQLLTMAFWGPVSLWMVTSIALPLLGGWFINLKGDRGYDAVSFNMVKALAAWIVYLRAGVGGESREIVEMGVPGGTVGMLVGAGVGGLAGLYEAVLKK